jgi:hypothetical protein
MHLHRIRIQSSIAVQVQLYLDCESNRYRYLPRCTRARVNNLEGLAYSPTLLFKIRVLFSTKQTLETKNLVVEEYTFFLTMTRTLCVPKESLGQDRLV